MHESPFDCLAKKIEIQLYNKEKEGAKKTELNSIYR